VFALAFSLRPHALGWLAALQLVYCFVLPLIPLFVFASPIVNAAGSGSSFVWIELLVGYAASAVLLLQTLPGVSEQVFEELCKKHHVGDSKSEACGHCSEVASHAVTWRASAMYLFVFYALAFAVLPVANLPAQYVHGASAVVASLALSTFRSVIVATI
jgi:hypothetical protein